MIRSSHRSLSVLLCVGALAGGPAAAQGFPDIVYELGEGSTLLDDCFCDHLPIEVPIRGSMVLRRQPVRIVGELYSIQDVSFKSVQPAPGGLPSYDVTGTGSFYRRASEPDMNSMTLDATVNGVAGIQISSDQVEAKGVFPKIDITIAEGHEPARDPFHIYSLHIVAEPVSKSQLYEVVEGSFDPFQGSFFYDDCNFCGRVTIPLPVKGSFVLRQQVKNEGNPVMEFTVEDLQMKTTRENFEFKIMGSGTYKQGGEFALAQSMVLKVDVNDEKEIVLSSGEVTVPEDATFPDIQIRLEQQDPRSPAHVFKLDLVARLSTAPPPREFRRGDANADGSGDISDAVFILLWRFSGGSEPTCLEAADVNDDGQHDLTDAVFLLLHLFQGGDAPPSPGLLDCGPVKQMTFGCESYPCG